MSMLNIVVIDKQQALWGTVHGSVAHRMVASLSEEPVSIEELETALERFEKPSDASLFDLFNKGIYEKPYDAGILIIDLRYRVVAGEQNYFALTRQGKVAYHNGQHATDTYISYRLSEDWKLLDDIDEWKVMNR